MGPSFPDGSCPSAQRGCINGSVSRQTLDDTLMRILAPMYEFDLFTNAVQWSNLSKRTLDVTSVEHSKLARDISAAATVLLRNERGTLPIGGANTPKAIAVIGAQGMAPSVHGGGSGGVIPTYVISPLQGICGKANESNSGVTSCVYEPGEDLEKAATIAASVDLAIVIVGDPSSEGSDRKSLSFSGNQDELVATVAAAATRTVVVALNPGAVLLPWAKQTDALLLMFTPGLECGHALADVLWGKVSPSGRLPITLPAFENQVGLTPAQYPGIANETGPGFLTSNYSERLLVGYRAFDQHKLEPAFCFGHGLSFTSFAYADLNASTSQVSLTLTNNGTRAGAEVVQLYLSFPASAGEPPQQLKAFEKVHLAAGASATVTLPLTQRSFSIWSVEHHAWVTVSGEFGVAVGASSRDHRLTGSVTQP